MACSEPAMVAGWLDLAASWNDLTERADRRRGSV
jgi:hypothetical protein